MNLRNILKYGEIITMYLSSKENLGTTSAYNYEASQIYTNQKDRRVRKCDYMITDVYPHFVEVVDKNGDKTTFDTGDLVMSRVINGGGGRV